ncbi:MAG: hypothetical protein KJO85_02030, partial [Gammaproteobacteria bacterium]|nr:hypothetical protein [Gammaproteobacteria bacterium]
SQGGYDKAAGDDEQNATDDQKASIFDRPDPVHASGDARSLLSASRKPFMRAISSSNPSFTILQHRTRAYQKQACIMGTGHNEPETDDPTGKQPVAGFPA